MKFLLVKMTAKSFTLSLPADLIVEYSLKYSSWILIVEHGTNNAKAKVWFPGSAWTDKNVKYRLWIFIFTVALQCRVIQPPGTGKRVVFCAQNQTCYH